MTSSIMTDDGDRTEATVDGLFTHRARGDRADSIALVHGRREVTFGALDELADGAAATLSSYGVQRGDLVGVHMTRSPEAIAIMLGTMRLGAGYVPIDPADPPARVAEIAAVADVAVVVCDDSRLDGAEPARIGVSTTSLMAAARTNRAPRVGPGMPSDVAYVIFTSGSTGKPKGAAMPHSSLVNLLSWHSRVRAPVVGTKTAQICSFAFDFSFHEIFSTICLGGTLVFADDEVRRNPFELSRFLQDQGIERLFVPVTLLEHLADAVDQTPVEFSVRDVITTGERLVISPTIRRLFDRTAATLHNHYGATEFQDASTHSLEPTTQNWPNDVPVGDSIDGVQVHVVDNRLRAVREGEGEIFVAGAGLAHGYVGRPALTATRFVANPFGPGRLYRTGDLARRDAVGRIDVIGRIDDQVKVRGVRIDCGEVETLLRGHWAVLSAVVQAPEVAGHRRLVAHVVIRAGVNATPDPTELHRYLAAALPTAMLPESYEFLDEMPLTRSGKLDRRRLAVPERFTRLAAGPVVAPHTRTERVLVESWSTVLRIRSVSIDDSFFDLGGTSLLMAELQRDLSDRLDRPVPMMDILRFPTLRAFAAFIDSTAGGGGGAHITSRRARNGSSSPRGDIAIIGMAGRFPGAEGVEALWSNLIAGIESVRPLMSVDVTQLDSTLTQSPDYVRMGATLNDIESVDARFFGLSPREAQILDPQHRVFLECAWEAMESAGFVPGADPAVDVGVFAGAGSSSYLVNNLVPHFGYGRGNVLTESDLQQFQLKIGNDSGYLSTRTSHTFDLRGPSVSVATACSTSLVSVHLACQSLTAGECDLALAGGVHITVPQESGYLYEPGMILSPDGHTRTFDAAASGTLFGNGCGVVVLKPLEAAIADGDPITAVIRGSAINNDGAGKMTFTAPSADRQRDVICDALDAAGIDSDAVGYVEAHGTGTAIGDPIEVAALTEAFAARRGGDGGRGRCVIGSIKSNLGHLDEAAGIAGLIKAALTVQRGVIPPTLHFDTPNSEIDFASTPFDVSTTAQPWDPDSGTRVAGVSSFGVGGTNCHVVLGESPERSLVTTEATSPSTEQLLCLSAHTPAALAQVRESYLTWLRAHDAPRLADICFTAATGRRHFEHRIAVVASTAGAAATALAAADPGGALRGRTAFLFPGQGSQYPGMGRALYERFPVFREVIDHCSALTADRLGTPLLSVIFAEPDERAPLGETAYAQPAIFAIEYALAVLWRSLGVEPDIVMGHSHGEYAAACVAGVMSAEDAVTLVCERGRLMESLAEPGAMIAVAADERTVMDLVGDRSWVAAVNSAESTVISTPLIHASAISSELAVHGITTSRLDISIGSHSPLMTPMLADYRAVTESITYSTPTTEIISSMTGEFIGDEIACAGYWVEQMTRPVQFLRGTRTLASSGASQVVEISPRPTLLQLIADEFAELDTELIPSMRPDRQLRTFLEAAGRLYQSGGTIDLTSTFDQHTRRLSSAPTYPWQRERHWIAAPPVVPSRAGTFAAFPGTQISLAGGGGTRFDGMMGPRSMPWLADHQVFGTVVMPGVALQAMAISAATRACGTERVELSDFVIGRAMDFGADHADRQVQVAVAPVSGGNNESDADGEFTVEVYSRTAAHVDGVDKQFEWISHASGRVQRLDHISTNPTDMDALLACFDGYEVDVNDIYRGEREREIDLGPAFQVTECLWRHGTTALSRIRLTEPTASEIEDHVVHPVLLEACLLAITVTYPERFGRRTYVPLGVESIRIERPAGDTAWCHTRLTASEDDDPETLWADVELIDVDGRGIASMSRVMLKRAEPTTMLGRDRAVDRRHYYRTQWEPTPVPAAAAVRGERWLVIAEPDLGAGLAERIRADGIGCTESPFADGPAALASADNCAPFDRIVICWPDDGIDTDHGGALSAAAAQLLKIAQRVALSDPPLPQLCVVTRGAQPVGGRSVTSPAQAALWGMGRVIAAEHPEMRYVHIDLDGDTPAQEVIGLIQTELLAMSPNRADQIGYHGSRRHVARLTAATSQREGDGAAETVEIRTEATYLVTGGLGALGLQTATTLASAGARHILLLGRSAPGLAADAVLEDLTSRGVHVESVVCDVADVNELRTVLDRMDDNPGLPPLAGILHLAGVIDDGVLLLQSPGRLGDVIGPKARGAWNLHQLTETTPLDFFVVFSSVSAVLGSPGQVTYAAANAFLDGLAFFRRDRGLPATSIQWGSWAEVGMSARAGLDDTLRRTGEGVIRPRDGMAMLADLLISEPDDAAIAVIAAEWHRFDRRDKPMLRDYLSALPWVRPTTTPDDADALTIALAHASQSQRSDLVLDHVRAQVARVLGGPGDLDDGANIFAAGLDSLTAIELKRNLERSLGVRLRQGVAFDHPTVLSLAEHIFGSVCEAANDVA